MLQTRLVRCTTTGGRQFQAGRLALYPTRTPTVAAKLAHHLQKRGRRPLLVAADVVRPAAVEQLQTLAAPLGVPVHVGAEGEAPPAICAAAAERARREGRDAIVYDTAGRLAIDDELMRELEEITAAVTPGNTPLVCDALMVRLWPATAAYWFAPVRPKVPSTSAAWPVSSPPRP